jgi:hypothetical protein
MGENNFQLFIQYHIITTLRVHLTLEQPSSRTKTALNAGEDAVKQEPLYTVGGNAN